MITLLMACLWVDACLMILFPAAAKSVCSHDDDRVIHGLRARDPSRLATTSPTSTDRDEQPSTPETLTALSESANEPAHKFLRIAASERYRRC